MGGQLSLVPLFHHRWAVPIVAELHRRQGDRFVFLAHRFAISRESLAQTLGYLIHLGLVRRNPGYGHPLRPEYLLTERGARLGPFCVRLDDLLNRNDHASVGLRKWTMPLLLAFGTRKEGSRFSEFLASFPALTPRALSASLKQLEQIALVQREVIAEFPPSTRYTLTSKGQGYLQLLKQIAKAIA